MTDLETAYLYCQHIAKQHYENFPVASRLLPRHLRRAVCVIYAFARMADDIADEGDASQQERLDELSFFRQQLQLIKTDRFDGEHFIFVALNDVIKRHQLPIDLFQDLLDAFTQDIHRHEYQTNEDILDYCRCSAHPIGRLLLHLHGKPSDKDLRLSDDICTALQLVNFYQDISQDWQENQRIYLPLSVLSQANLTKQVLNDDNSTEIAAILREQYRITVKLFSNGLPLGEQLSGRLAWEIRAITLTGIHTLKQLSLQADDQLFSRPRLSKLALIKQCLLALFPTIYMRYGQANLLEIAKINRSAND